jgi:hypothetical protein
LAYDWPAEAVADAACGTFCVYDECTSDSACTSGGVCACSNSSAVCEPFGTLRQGPLGTCGLGNTCVSGGNCRVDSDCGPNGLCSPRIDTCDFLSGYFCHTAADECVADSDCPEAGAPLCLFDPSNSRWECTYWAECP